MTYNFVINRIRRVIKSCRTLEQIEVAKNYAAQLLGKYISEMPTGGDDLSGFFEIKQKRRELVKWVGALLRKQKIEVRL